MTAENNPNFNPEKYTAIASNHLVAYAIYSLQNDGDEISAEDIISACFMLFPRKFSLRTYPQWPDSALIGRRLHDCERKGWLTARIDTGFKLTALGTRLAEKVAKGLGVTIPKKEKPKKIHKLQVGKLQVDKLQVTKTAEPAPATTKPAKKARKKRVDKLQVTEAVKPVGKLQVDKSQVAETVKPAVVKPKPAKKVKEKQVAEVKVAEVVKPAPVAKPAPVKPKVEKVKEKQVAEEKPAPVKPAPAVKPEPVAKPKAKVTPPSTVPTVSAEEKAKAGKFVKMMETSDAYRLYKKSGANANIGEFDFRSLLLCTMESSHETLARNVDLFKGYAEIHNRQDLVAFLAVCSDKFAHLLTPEKKA